MNKLIIPIIFLVGGVLITAGTYFITKPNGQTGKLCGIRDEHTLSRVHGFPFRYYSESGVAGPIIKNEAKDKSIASGCSLGRQVLADPNANNAIYDFLIWGAASAISGFVLLKLFRVRII